MRTATHARRLRRTELLAQIASEREAVAQTWRTFGERLGTLQTLTSRIGGLTRSPLFYIATAGAGWFLGRRRGLALLRKVLSVLGG